MRIAVYSGSFDPLHIGHQAIMEYLTREKSFDWVYLVISPQNPFKDPSKAATGEKRYRAAIEAVRRHPELHVWVDNIELNMEPPHYTIRTLDALRRREPDNEFTLVVGADNLENMLGWRDAPRILTEYGVAVYPRQGFDVEAIRKFLYDKMLILPSPYTLDYSSMHDTPGTVGLEESERLYKIDIIDAPIVNISSTRIREGLAKGEDMSAWMM